MSCSARATSVAALASLLLVTSLFRTEAARAQDPGPATPHDEGSVEVVTECVERNIPKESSVQIVELTAVDRIGGEEVSRAKIKGKRFPDDLRRLIMKFTRPTEMRGSALLALEQTERSPDMFVYTPELRKTKRVTGSGACSNLFGTDIDCEVFAQWHNLRRPGETKRRADDRIVGRSVYVTDTFSPPEDSNRYEKVRVFVDQESCVTLRSEFYEKAGEDPRKLMLANPDELMQEQGIWIPTDLRVEDLLDETHTRIIVEDVEIDVPMKEREFSLGELAKGSRR